MKLVYVSGPYTAYKGSKHEDVTVEQNIAKARVVAEDLWVRGWAVICPHLNTANMSRVATYETFIQGDLEMVKRCDAIYMIEGWEKSNGAERELSLATQLGKFIMSETNND